MKKRLLSLTCVILIFFYAASCTALFAGQKQEYESLKKAVGLSKFPVKAKFGHHIPPDFDAQKFMQVVEGKIPPNSYDVLQKYHLQVVPKEGYYLIKVFNPENNALILFSYSCETGTEGTVWENPGKYDVNNLQLYDKCKKRH